MRADGDREALRLLMIDRDNAIASAETARAALAAVLSPHPRPCASGSATFPVAGGRKSAPRWPARPAPRHRLPSSSARHTDIWQAHRGLTGAPNCWPSDENAKLASRLLADGGRSRCGLGPRGRTTRSRTRGEIDYERLSGKSARYPGSHGGRC
jgi:hypothetical protein